MLKGWSESKKYTYLISHWLLKLIDNGLSDLLSLSDSPVIRRISIIDYIKISTFPDAKIYREIIRIIE
jgi:hypothetical protein